MLSIEPICRIARPGSAFWNWLRLFVEGYVPKLIEQGLWTGDDLNVFERDWAEASMDPNSFFFTPPMVGIVARK